MSKAKISSRRPTTATTISNTYNHNRKDEKMEKRIERFCEVDPMEFFVLPPKEAPADVPLLELNIYPKFAEFIEFGGASKHVLTNAGSARLVIKVKCSNNSLFKVSPVFAFLDPGSSTDLQILRQEGPTRNDKLLVIYKEVKKKDEKDPKKAFEANTTTAKKVLPLITRDTADEN